MAGVAGEHEMGRLRGQRVWGIATRLVFNM